MRNKIVLVGTLILAAACVPLPAKSRPLPKTSSHPTAQKDKTPTVATHETQLHPNGGQRNGQNGGQRIFEQNCSRCHNAPDGFSTNISGTIVRHMRVRASLSEHDAQELLRFFNP